MTALELSNLALNHLGISQEIEDLEEETREAFTMGKIYDHVLRACLRRFPWAFATKYADLSLVRGPFWDDDPTELTLVQAFDADHTYVAGDVVRAASVNYYCILATTGANAPPNATYWSTATADAPDYANGDWIYGYRYPSDCLYARRLFDDATGRKFNPAAIPMRRGRDDNGLLIYTDRQAATLEYTMLDCTDLWSDDLFLRYFTWSLAAEACAGLERAQKTKKECLEIAEIHYSIATARDINESQQEPPGDPEWTRNR